MKSVFIFLVIIGFAASFAPTQNVARATLELAATRRNPIAAVSAGIIPAIVTASAAMATEGTNEWFGVGMSISTEIPFLNLSLISCCMFYTFSLTHIIVNFLQHN